ncbi:MAG: hypothetical protein WBA28_02575 [Microbacteriaceae bacterium]
MARKRRVDKWSNVPDPEESDFSYLLGGFTRSEVRRSGQWSVQTIGPGRSEKVYKCPGCGLDVNPGIAHLVAWRADDILGEESAIAARRHWHNHCWKVSL